MILEKYFARVYPVISYIFRVHLLGLILFFAIRLILLLTNIQNIENIKYEYIIDAFALGFFIDNVIVSSISFIPILASIVICVFTDIQKKVIQYVYNLFFILIYSLVFAVSIANIPYFNYFYKHIDKSIISWFKFDTEGYSMIVNETGYYKYYIFFIIIILIFSYLTILFSKIWIKSKTLLDKSSTIRIIKYSSLFIVFALLCFMGIRKKHGLMQPILEWTTYLSPSSFANALTTNAIYNYTLSLTTPEFKDKEIKFAPSLDTSLALLKADFNSQEYNESVSPISRMIRTEGEPLKANVVVVLMESMSSYYLTETPHLTPFLNQLKKQSLYFDNFYSVATHTNQGIFSSLYGFPSYFDKVIMEDRAVSGQASSPRCEGLPVILKDKGYDLSFFVSHNKSYNNMDMFLYKNGYDINQIHSIENYPESKIRTSWGVADDYLFEYATNIFNEKKDQLFFGTIMTISNHPEYYIPEEFMHISKKETERAVYFADYSIKQFIENAQKTDWFKNTIFVFVGDHGRLEGNQYFEMPLSLNHVPMIIYSPLFRNNPKTISEMGTQTDIFPTVMGILNIEYENNSLGIDLLKEKHSYAVFSSDDKLGCINQQYLYCYNTISRQEFLYDYRNNNPNNIMNEFPLVFDSIRNYASASVKVTNYLLENNLSRRKQ